MRLSRALQLIAVLAPAIGLGCNSGTSADDAPTTPPNYIWTGVLIDSVTGQGVGGVVASVRERPDHMVGGWDPYLTSDFAENGRFGVIYYLRGVFPCSAFPETTLTLHLDIADPSNRYAGKTIQSDSFIVCPRVLPPPERLPLNFEDSLRILLTPIR